MWRGVTRERPLGDLGVCAARLFEVYQSDTRAVHFERGSCTRRLRTRILCSLIAPALLIQYKDCTSTADTIQGWHQHC